MESPAAPGFGEEVVAEAATNAREIEDLIIECMKERGFEYERTVESEKHHPELLSLVGSELWGEELRSQYALGVATLAVPAELLTGDAIGSPLRVGHSFDARMLPGQIQRSLSYWDEYNVALYGSPGPPPGSADADRNAGCLEAVASLATLDPPALDSGLSEVGPIEQSTDEEIARIEQCMLEAGLAWTGFEDYRDSVLATTNGFTYSREGDAFALDRQNELTLLSLQADEFVIDGELRRCDRS